jgi:hypothetical protein
MRLGTRRVAGAPSTSSWTSVTVIARYSLSRFYRPRIPLLYDLCCICMNYLVQTLYITCLASEETARYSDFSGIGHGNFPSKIASCQMKTGG